DSIQGSSHPVVRQRSLASGRRHGFTGGRTRPLATAGSLRTAPDPSGPAPRQKTLEKIVRGFSAQSALPIFRLADAMESEQDWDHGASIANQVSLLHRGSRKNVSPKL